MKKIISILLLLVFLTGTAQAVPTYGPDYYQKNLRYATKGKGTGDPIYHFIKEMASFVLPTTGHIFYVDSDVVSEGDGTTWDEAKNTIQEAIDLCTANRGDTIYVAPGHAENIATAAAISADCAGITIVGVGFGDDMPELASTANASTFSISAPDITIAGIRFLGNFATGTAVGVSVTADGDGANIIGCEFRETSNNTELLIMINAATGADRLNIIGNSFVGATGGSDSSAIVLAGASNKTVIEDNLFDGDWSDYVIKASGATSVQMLIKDNVIANFDTTQGYIMSFAAASTGNIIGNKCYGNGAAFAIVGDAMFVSPDNVTMGTENVETRTFESMFGAFTGAGGVGQGSSIYADMVLAQTDLDAILADTALWDTTAELQTILFGSATPGATTTDFATYKLNYLISADDRTASLAYPDSVAGESILAFLMSKSASPIKSSYNNTTDSLEALRDNMDTLNTADQIDLDAILADTAAVDTTSEMRTFLTDSDTPIARREDSNSIITAVAVADVNTTIAGVVGMPTDSDHTVVSTAVVSNPDGSLYERQEYMQKLQEVLTAEQLRSIAGSAMPLAVWYVDPAATGGTGDGKSPANAFTTLTLALAACSNTVNDWILVFDYSGGEASTITINKSFVHIIGNACKGMPYPRIKPATAVAGITFEDTGDRVEIANMVIGGGDQTVSAIDFNSPAGAYGCYIHDCIIGRDADAPALEGIHVPSGSDAPYLHVENNTFYGSDGAGIAAAGSAIRISGNATRCNIIDNYIQDIGRTATPAIWFDGSVTNPRIENNKIKFDTDTSTGSAITLSANVDDGWIANNYASDGKDAPANNPFVDAGSTNGWSGNYSGIVLTLP